MGQGNDFFKDQKQMTTPQPKQKKSRFDLCELIGQLLIDFYARY